jgi:hypothetical protein
MEKTTMFKLFACIFLVAVSCSLAFGGEPASTAAAVWNTGFVLAPDPNVCGAPPLPPPAACVKWTTVLTTDIKNPTADDDLFIDVSQVNRLSTTTITSSATPALVSTGDAKLEMRVLVDGVTAKPGNIVFDEQLSTLTSNLQAFQALSCTATPTPQTIVTTSCVCNPLPLLPLPVISCDPAAAVPVGYTRTCTTQTQTDTDVVTTCSLGSSGTNQTLRTVLAETLAHSFDFYAPGVGGRGDTHIVQVQERLHLTSGNGGSATATIGPGTLKITAVNVK